MSNVLRLYIGEHWPQQPKTKWVLLSAQGSLLQEGESVPTHWPEAEVCEAILSGMQCVWLHTRMPEKLPRRDYTRLLANALEDQIIDEPEKHHLTVTQKQEQDVGVLVIDRERLKQVVTQFSALGRPLSSAYSELQTAPAGEGAWHLTFAPESAIFRRNNDDGTSLDLPPEGGLPESLVALSRTALEVGNAPTVTIHMGSTANEVPELAAWESLLGLAVVSGAAHRWHDINEKPANLLHSVFAPIQHSRQAWLKKVRPALWLAVIVSIADFLITATQVGWLRYQMTSSEHAITAVFRTAFPSTPVIDAVAQTKQHLNQLRATHGMLQSDDVLSLLREVADTLTAAGGQSLNGLHYESGKIELTLPSTNAINVESLRQQLAAKGLDMAVETSNGSTKLILSRREMR